MMRRVPSAGRSGRLAGDLGQEWIRWQPLIGRKSGGNQRKPHGPISRVAGASRLLGWDAAGSRNAHFFF